QLDLGTGVEVDVALAAVQGDHVAGLDLGEDAAQSGHGGDAQGAGEDGGVAGGGAGLGEDAGDPAALDEGGLGGQDLRGDEDDRLLEVEGGLVDLAGELDQDAADDVAQVGEALLEVGVGDACEDAGVLVEGLA